MTRAEARDQLAALGYTGDHAEAILQDAWDWSVCRTVHQPFVSSLVARVTGAGDYSVEITPRTRYGLVSA